MSSFHIGLLVAVTDDAARKSGGASALRDRFLAALARAQAAFLRCETGVVLSVVGSHTLGAAFATRDVTAALDACVDGEAGASLRAARAQAGAHLVVVLAGPLLPVRGKAFVMSEPDPRFERFAYAIVNVRALLGESMTLAHELGHLFGADHNRASIEGVPPAGPAFGWQFTADGVDYRTIMSRAPGTVAPVFSSPRIRHCGVACGSESADNAGVIRANASIVAEFA